MQPSFVIFSMIMVFACMMLLVILAGPLSAMIKFVLRSCIGAGLIYACNVLFAPFGIYIGVNILTACMIGFLGLPGLGTLMILGHILGV